MSSRARRLSTFRWPIWLLIAGWFCANGPQAASYALLTWLAEARHFSHQQRLVAGVAFVLAGEKPAGDVALIADEPAPAAPSAMPVEAVLKRIVLAMERVVDASSPAISEEKLEAGDLAMAGALRAPPPHEPPRRAMAA